MPRNNSSRQGRLHSRLHPALCLACLPTYDSRSRRSMPLISLLHGALHKPAPFPDLKAQSIRRAPVDRMLDPSISGLMLRIIAGDEVISRKEHACSSSSAAMLPLKATNDILKS